MAELLHSFAQRIVGAWARRMPAGSHSKRLLLDTIFWQLEEVTYSRLKEKGLKPSCVIDIGAHYQVITFMDERGFAIYDIAGFVRPNQKDLAQIDVIFVRKDSKLRPDRFRFADPRTA